MPSAQNMPKISPTYTYIYTYIYSIYIHPQNISNIAKIAGWFLPTSRLLWPSLTSAPLDSMVAFRPVVSLQSSRSSMNFPREPRVSWMFLFGLQVCSIWKFQDELPKVVKEIYLFVFERLACSSSMRSMYINGLV